MIWYPVTLKIHGDKGDWKMCLILFFHFFGSYFTNFPLIIKVLALQVNGGKLSVWIDLKL